MHTSMEVTTEVLSEFVGGEIIFRNDNSGHSYLYKGRVTDIKTVPGFTQIFVELTQSAVGQLHDRAEVTWDEATGPRGASSVILRNPGVLLGNDTVAFDVPTDRGSTAVIIRA